LCEINKVQLFPAIDQLMNKCKTHLKYTSHSDHKTFEHEFVLVLEKGRRVRDRIAVGFTTTYAINAYHH